MFKQLTHSRPRPDVRAWLAHLSGECVQPVPPVTEFIVDESAIRAVVTGLIGRAWQPYGPERDSQVGYLDNLIAFWQFMGYDYVRFERGLSFPAYSLAAQNTAQGAANQRNWVDEHRSAIDSIADLEGYPFPTLEQVDFFPFEYLNDHIPDGMGLILAHAGGFLEHLTWTLSMEGLCYKLYDQPELVNALMERIGSLQLDFYRQIIELDRLVALWPGDDMGFRSGTLIRPADLRRIILPWHRRLAEMAHARGLKYFLHSCGNLEPIMNDLIDDVRIDGRHSFEDAIMPVEQFYDRYSERIAVLGGMDINFLATAAPTEIRTRTRSLAEHCCYGHYAIGSGNSIPDYVPVENYLAMIDEALEMRANHVP